MAIRPFFPGDEFWEALKVILLGPAWPTTTEVWTGIKRFNSMMSGGFKGKFGRLSKGRACTSRLAFLAVTGQTQVRPLVASRLVLAIVCLEERTEASLAERSL